MLRRVFLQYPRIVWRLLEVAVPIVSWGAITLPFWLSFYHPAVASYFVIFFIVYWFYKSATTAYFGLKSYLTMRAHMGVDWLSMAKKIKNFQKIHHLIIIPEYSEPLSVLDKTIESIKRQDFPTNKMSICLATEERDIHASQTADYLIKKYRKYFANMWVSTHRIMPGEVAGKSSNMACGARYAVEKLKKKNIDFQYTTVTSCDADALLHPKYFSYLTYKFLKDDDRYYHFYQASVMFYSNIWDIPLPSRVLNTIGSIFSLSLLSQKSRLINFSTYSLHLQAVIDVGYWSVDIIPEDYHMFFKMFYHLGEKVRVIPLFLPTLVQAAQSKTFWRTMINQYEQQKRWAWGVSDIPYVVYKFVLDSKIPFMTKAMRLVYLLEWHVIWATNWFILTLGAFLPSLVNKNFARTNLGHNLSQVSSFILTLCILFVIVIIVLDAKVKPPRPKNFSRWKIPFLYVQWITLPVVSFFLSALPGLDAHTRLMLGKKLTYRVTEKM